MPVGCRGFPDAVTASAHEPPGELIVGAEPPVESNETYATTRLPAVVPALNVAAKLVSAVPVVVLVCTRGIEHP
jgi:hypothetical protein